MPWKWTLENKDSERDPYFDQIAQAACRYITAYSTIYVNSGTIGNMMVKYFPNIEFTLVTNSILIANFAYKKCSLANIVVIGGQMRDRGVCDDEISYQQLAKYEYDISFITGEGFTYETGLTNSSNKTALLHKLVLTNTKYKKILLLPHFKIGKVGAFKVGDIDQIDIVITNKKAEENCSSQVERNKKMSTICIDFV